MAHPGKAMARRQRGRLYPLHIHIAYLFTLLIFVACSVIGWFNYHQSRRIVLSAAENVFERTARQTGDDLARLYGPLETLVELLVHHPLTTAPDLDSRLRSLPMLRESLVKNPRLSAAYVGYPNGDFFLVRSLDNAAVALAVGSPEGARFLVQSMERQGLHGEMRRPTFIFYDEWLQELARSHPADYTFDPRGRPWFQRAADATELVRTDPYVFFTTREVGKTFARQAAGGAVVAADLTLAEISESLADAGITPGTQLVLVDGQGRVLADKDAARLSAASARSGGRPPQLADLGSPVLARLASREVLPLIQVDGRYWHSRALPVAAAGEAPNYLLVAAPEDELLEEAVRIRNYTLWVTLGLIALAIPGTWWLARRISSELKDLIREAAEIRRFRFDGAPAKGSSIWEINELSRSMNQMKGTIRKFLDISATLASERNFDRLLARVLQETLASAEACGGIVYLMPDNGRGLLPASLLWHEAATEAAENGGEDEAGETTTTARIVDASRLPGLAFIASPRETHPLLLAAQEARTQVLEVPPQRPAGMEFLDSEGSALVGQPVLLVALPLKNRAQEVIGVLALFLPGSAEAPAPERISFIEALSGASAVAIENQRLIQSQKALLEGLIRLMAGAIDAKSPYTGGHCQRVPELTKMLARAACEADSGPYAGFSMDEEAWEALHIAGWLHDCGKVTTPEYVVDKATKLETLYDRIHEVRMRFEVLKRDAEIDFWQQVAAGGDAATLRQALEAQWAVLDEEFAFVAACNEGSEFMAPEKQARLQAIACRTWRRTLDDRLGISWEEGQRKAHQPPATLPVTEALLADRPEHLLERAPRDLMPAENPWGFHLQVPAWKFNRGELHNLSVGRGTLSEEDRYIINDHIVQTIIMLEALPFPLHLRQVPELAGGHHERMDGRGYPRGLKGSEMSPQARMMAIADIFEALTAVDRPYKKGKTLSEALAIMARMVQEQHIDRELFELFLRTGVYRQYGERYLQARQIDEVDVAALLA
ncbi:phosphodiesterase [Azospira sp. I13]|uniref:HD domain-containing phosphohydrolase n=1 Tax=Azospira sp. I13 TaxID=1765050 RepID=UPI000D4F74FB|nr:HD domain-containing phosphohydrolase [Azospira sp. I13]GBG02515.1 phosphodiesterase [Azospira sp. I13]